MARLLVLGVAALVLFGTEGLRPVVASTVVVPDDISTVQLAIDSGADTVLIRAGTYPERPVVDHAVVLQGIGIDQRPRLSGLQIYNLGYWGDPPLLSVSRIDFAGRIAQTTVAVHPRNLQFNFTECALDSGFGQVLSMDPDDVASLTFRNCRMRIGSNARAYTVVMESDTVDGGVAWRVREPWIRDCWFRGGPGIGIRLTDEPHSGFTIRNRVENYQFGIYVDYGISYDIDANTIIRCDTGILLTNGSDVVVADNEIRDCGVGVDVQWGDALTFLRNTIVRARGRGMTVHSAALVVEQNVVARCDGDGLVLDDVDIGSVLGRNTFFMNGGSGIVVATATVYPIAIQGNIVFGNLGWGLSVAPGQVVDLGCNDWFGNGLGAASGVVADPTDLSVDPLFCGVDSADVRLDSASPLLNVAGCGQIGALGVGCGVTATLVQRFTAERASEGIRVVWQVAGGATASEVWLERLEGTSGEGWMQPVTERAIENRAVVELDRSAVSDRAYWYRLMAREGSGATVIGPPIIVGAQAKLEFKLVAVGPSPGSGPVRIGFALKHAAAIEIDVFDVQGRRVASPGRGVWASGTHAVEWDGRTRRGEATPAGLYLVRYVYPGGQDRRAIVHMW